MTGSDELICLQGNLLPRARGNILAETVLIVMHRNDAAQEKFGAGPGSYQRAVKVFDTLGRGAL